MLDVRLALVAFAVLPVLAVAHGVVPARARGASYVRARDAISTVNAEMQESLAGVRVTQSLGRDDNNGRALRRPLGASTATPACARCS